MLLYTLSDGFWIGSCSLIGLLFLRHATKVALVERGGVLTKDLQPNFGEIVGAFRVGPFLWNLWKHWC